MIVDKLIIKLINNDLIYFMVFEKLTFLIE